MRKVIAIFVAATMLAACAPKPGQNQYYAGEAGMAVEVEYARVVGVKQVMIQDKSTGIGAGAGAAAGFAAGAQFGSGDGQVASALAGLIIGAVGGAIAEQELQNQVGYQYTVVTKAKKTKTIVQQQGKDDIVFKKGDRVMIQTEGAYQRVIATDDMPEQIKNVKEIKVVD